MPKVYGIHTIALRPGVTEEEFERFVKEEVSAVEAMPGWKGYLLKGDRGERAGKYLWVYEIESVEVRDRAAPSETEFSAEAMQYFESHPEFGRVMEKFAKLTNGLPSLFSTDYVVVE